jgi:EF-hand domain-containing protein 1
LVLYHLEDHTIMIIEPKEVNSGTPQGTFLKRQLVLKQDGSDTPLLPTDFRVGLDVGIFGRCIRITDCDEYTREFFAVRYYYILNVVYLLIIVEYQLSPA